MSANRRPGRECGSWALGAVGVIGLLVGLNVGVIIAGSDPDWFTANVTLGQILQSGIFLFVFLVANHYYVKTHAARKMRAEIRADVADIVSDAVKNVHSVFSKFADLGENSESLHLELSRSLREYSNAIGMLETAVKDLDLGVSPGFNELYRDREAYKDLLTGSPYPTSVPMSRFGEESNMYRRIQSNILLFRLALTRT